MVHRFVVPLLLATFCWTGAPLDSGSTGESGDEFSLSCNRAGKSIVEIEKGRLHYVWHTFRKWDGGGQPHNRNDETSFDRHEVRIWLTRSELKRLRDWFLESGIKETEGPFPRHRSGGVTRASGYQTRIEAKWDGGEHSLSWHGDLIVPSELKLNVSQLFSICEEIEIRRRPED